MYVELCVAVFTKYQLFRLWTAVIEYGWVKNYEENSLYVYSFFKSNLRKTILYSTFFFNQNHNRYETSWSKNIVFIGDRRSVGWKMKEIFGWKKTNLVPF